LFFETQSAFANLSLEMLRVTLWPVNPYRTRRTSFVRFHCKRCSACNAGM